MAGNQSKVDSVMEAVTNNVIGFPLALVVWHFVALAFGIPMPIQDNIMITLIFTVVSLLRQFILRRLFNGRTVWQAIKSNSLWHRVQW